MVRSRKGWTVLDQKWPHSRCQAGAAGERCDLFHCRTRSRNLDRTPTRRLNPSAVQQRTHHNRNLRPGEWAGAKQCVRHLPGSRRSSLGGYPDRRRQQTKRRKIHYLHNHRRTGLEHGLISPRRSRWNDLVWDSKRPERILKWEMEDLFAPRWTAIRQRKLSL